MTKNLLNRVKALNLELTKLNCYECIFRDSCNICRYSGSNVS